MAQGYQLIQSQTLSSAAASVTFSNIPQNYSDLVLKVSARAVGVDNQLTFNGSTTSDSSRYLFSSGTATSSATTTFCTTNADWAVGGLVDVTASADWIPWLTRARPMAAVT